VTPVERRRKAASHVVQVHSRIEGVQWHPLVAETNRMHSSYHACRTGHRAPLADSGETTCCVLPARLQGALT
jgi:hypothetical protein